MDKANKVAFDANAQRCDIMNHLIKEETMEKINIAELLKDCPKGMELDCTMYDNITFCGINERSTAPINIKRKDGIIYQLTKYGQPSEYEDAKCVIFPKGKTTWEGFHRPFKDEDIVFTNTGEHDWISIFKRFSENMCCTYIDLCINDDDLITDTGCLCSIEGIKTQRFATEEEKIKLFDTIKANGYKWNPGTKTLEELPKFKVGDTITNGKTSITIGYIDNEYYYEISRNIVNRLFIKNQDEWDLISEKFPNRFNINTLVPFESRVLVRNDEGQYWIPAFWGCKRANGYTTTFGWCKYCIPFEGNEHLLETTNDCNEYYKTWK